jgi:hypothetical protein
MIAAAEYRGLAVRLTTPALPAGGAIHAGHLEQFDQRALR